MVPGRRGGMSRLLQRRAQAPVCLLQGSGKFLSSPRLCAGRPGLTYGKARPDRVVENLDVFDFELTDDEMTRIAALDTGATVFFDHRDPAMVSWLGGRRVGCSPPAG